MTDLRPLQKKAEAAFDAFFEANKEKMVCAKGCSRCCVSGLSIFAWEASIIMDWFYELSPQQQKQWKERQNLPQSERPTFINSDNSEDLPCAFLREDQCTIYEARPSLCRTQGMALQFQEDNQSHRDWCPLNFIDGEPQDRSKDLNLDQLNAMLSQAQLIHEKENEEALGPIRVDLGDLRDYLIHHS